jgi:serine/threonine protein kinase
MEPSSGRVKAVFDQALRIEAPGERAAFLEKECAGEPAVRRRVEALLRVHADMGSILDQPILDAGVTRDPQPDPPADPPGDLDLGGRQPVAAASPAEGPGTWVGPYKLLQEIGQGGMGTVFLAEQREPVRRQVALKIIKADLASATSVARFEAERQALALMDHPHIAKVLDAGATAAGRPFFVMELVKGIPITKYCDDHRLPLRQRLELFVPICQALQHAHTKGVIHRDIKPSNVLVAPYDGVPVPKVIDFGIAKATGPRLTEKTLFTEFGAVIGTLEYMSPEQAELNNQDIDTRSDVYSLGVLLYELLTGTTPLAAQRRERTAFLELLRLIREEEPPRPSARLSSAQASLPAVSAQRQARPAQLARLVRGELDWIVMKALEKDRTRRYETANGLARDVQRYLYDEPVEACPPSTGYRLRKFARKHGRLLVTAVMFAALLVAGVIVSTEQAVRATRAEGAARRAEQEALRAQQTATERAEGERLAKLEAQARQAEAERQKGRAEKAAAAEKLANEQAQRQLQQIEKANDILGSIFANLDPKVIAQAGRPLQAILVEKLDAAVVQLEGESIGDPLVVAAMQVRLGRSLRGLGAPGKAIGLLEKARATRQARLGPEHPDTLLSMNFLAGAYQDAGKPDLALPLYEESFKLHKARLGPDHPHTLHTRTSLAAAYWRAKQLDKSIPLFEENLRRQEAIYGRDHPDTLRTVANLGVNYKDAGRLQEALPLLEEAHRATKKYPALRFARPHLLDAYAKAGETAKRANLLKEELAEARQRLPKDSP